MPVLVTDLRDGRQDRSKLGVALVRTAQEEEEAPTRREPWITMPSETRVMLYVPELAREPPIAFAGLNVPDAALFLSTKILMIAWQRS